MHVPASDPDVDYAARLAALELKAQALEREETELLARMAGMGCVALRRQGVRRLALPGAVGHGMRRRQAGTMLGWQDVPDVRTRLANLRHNLGVMMLHGAVDPLALEVHYRSCVRTRFHSRKISRSPVLTEALNELAIPILVVWGEHDTTGDPAELGPMWHDAGANCMLSPLVIIILQSGESGRVRPTPFGYTVDTSRALSGSGLQVTPRCRHQSDPQSIQTTSSRRRYHAISRRKTREDHIP